jgi:phytoene dehydrogenase-like protein
MADKEYDVVFVGGGQKAIVAAMYLTKYGHLKVGLFEERHELGTGWSSEEPAGGYVGNTCSAGHIGWYQGPLYRDFPEFEDYGARYAYTNAATGTVFDDQSCILQYAAFPDVDPDQTKTAELFSQYSQKDADTWLALWDKASKYWLPAMMEWAHNPAKSVYEMDAMDRLCMATPEAGIDPHWLMMTTSQLFSALFENPKIQLYGHRVCQSYGFSADDQAMGWTALLSVMSWLPYACYVVGGTHALTHAAFRIIAENGGEAKTSCKVDKILLEGNKATGIRLADGTEIGAKYVVTNVDPFQLIFNLIGADKVDEVISRKLNALSKDWTTIMWYSWALTERPKFTCEDTVPDAGYCMALGFGGEASTGDVNTFSNESAERRAKIWPKSLNGLYMYQGHQPDSNLDFDQCMGPPDNPEENFRIQTEQFVLPAYTRSDEEWKAIEKKHADDMINEISKYAPNVSWDIVNGYVPVTPHFTSGFARNYGAAGNQHVIENFPSQAGKFRPIPELAGHRVPGIEGVYCTGTAWPCLGFANCAQGYNVYKVMAEDLGLEKPWEGYAY